MRQFWALVFSVLLCSQISSVYGHYDKAPAGDPNPGTEPVIDAQAYLNSIRWEPAGIKILEKDPGKYAEIFVMVGINHSSHPPAISMAFFSDVAIVFGPNNITFQTPEKIYAHLECSKRAMVVASVSISELGDEAWNDILKTVGGGVAGEGVEKAVEKGVKKATDQAAGAIAKKTGTTIAKGAPIVGIVLGLVLDYVANNPRTDLGIGGKEIPEEGPVDIPIALGDKQTATVRMSGKTPEVPEDKNCSTIKIEEPLPRIRIPGTGEEEKGAQKGGNKPSIIIIDDPDPDPEDSEENLDPSYEESTNIVFSYVNDIDKLSSKVMNETNNASLESKSTNTQILNSLAIGLAETYAGSVIEVSSNMRGIDKAIIEFENAQDFIKEKKYPNAIQKFQKASEIVGTLTEKSDREQKLPFQISLFPKFVSTHEGNSRTILASVFGSSGFVTLETQNKDASVEIKKISETPSVFTIEINPKKIGKQTIVLVAKDDNSLAKTSLSLNVDKNPFIFSFQSSLIPSWMKQNAEWWIKNKISDREFAFALGFLVNQGIIPITGKTYPHEQIIVHEKILIPSWIKQNAKQWSDGTINDSDFILDVEYLIENKIIEITESKDVDAKSESKENIKNEDESKFKPEDPSSVQPHKDSDNDGIDDNFDQCPNEHGTDENGCPKQDHSNTDSDSDGFVDTLDNCPSSAEAYNGYNDDDGCPDTLPSSDSDNDGIANDLDQCLNQAETINGFEDNDGCPDTLPSSDSDNDGIANDLDQCLNQAETINGFEDNDGCPDEVPQEEHEKDTDSDTIPNSEDNCPENYNPGQNDSDGDHAGDACDAFPQDPNNDADGDGLGANADNCPAVSNPNQEDSDTDGVGDACEPIDESPSIGGTSSEDTRY